MSTFDLAVIGTLVVAMLLAVVAVEGNGSRPSRRRSSPRRAARPAPPLGRPGRAAPPLGRPARSAPLLGRAGRAAPATGRTEPAPVARVQASAPPATDPSAATSVGVRLRWARRPDRLVAAGGVLLTAIAMVAAPGLVLVPVPASGGWLIAIRVVRRRAAARRLAIRSEAAPAVLDLLGAALLAGLNPHRAVLRVAERAPDALREELELAAAVLRLGGTPAAALREAADHSGIDELRAAASAMEAAERWGAPPAEALAARAEALRSRARLHAEAEAGRAAVRLAFPLVLCFLPAFVLTNVEL
jgi:tight adherence protein C